MHAKHHSFKMPYFSIVGIVRSCRTFDTMSPCQLPYTVIVKSYLIQTKSQQTKPCLNLKLYQTDPQQCQWRSN